MIEEVICPKCRKLFCPAPQHIYKDSKGRYCSWTCFNHRKDGKKPSSWKPVIMSDESGKVIREYTSATNASQQTGYNLKCIQKACRENGKYNGYIWKYKEG